MPASFVGKDETRFCLNGEVWPVVGVNCYFLAYCADASRRAAMTTAKQMGANAIRTWAFADGASSCRRCRVSVHGEGRDQNR